MQKVTKTQVKSILKRLQQDQTTIVYFLPSKTAFSGFKCWIQPMEIELNNNLEEFEKTINEFYYYNCNSETGNRVHFYIKK